MPYLQWGITSASLHISLKLLAAGKFTFASNTVTPMPVVILLN